VRQGDRPQYSTTGVSCSDVQFVVQVKRKLNKLTLDCKKIAQTEKERFAKNPPNSPWAVKIAYHVLCWVLDFVYEGRPIQRFWVLEEVARMPYFSYISMLHLYETFGWWRAGAALRKVHFAEEWNELHHRTALLLQLCEFFDLCRCDRLLGVPCVLYQNH
jgi:hypothetical protein